MLGPHGRGRCDFPAVLHPRSGLQTQNLLDKATASPCLLFMRLGTFPHKPGASRMLQPSGAATWEAGSGLHEEASYLLRNCLCGILTIWKEYGNETFSEMELLS